VHVFVFAAVFGRACAFARATTHNAAMLVAFNKPFGVLCQFTDRGASPRPTLAGFGLPPAVYPAGRLDHDSEGLLLLTDDGRLAHRLTDPRHRQPKTYWVQVEGAPTAAQLGSLREGVRLRDGPTRPAQVRAIPAPQLWAREPPVRYRRTVPDAWLELVLCEGRNRQVRRMTAAVALPTLRLVRVAIGRHRLGGLLPGQWRLVPGEKS
jgi:23S rRNA pseudouridine2457 synthase